MWNERNGNKKEIYINWFVVLSGKWKHMFTLLLHATSVLMLLCGVFLINEDQGFIVESLRHCVFERLYIFILGLLKIIYKRRCYINPLTQIL